MKLTKEQYDALPEGLKALYKADGDGYVATFVTAEEVQGLRDNNAALLLEKKQAQDKETEAQRIAREAQEKADREAGNIAALDKSWGEKLTAAEAKAAADVERYQKALHAATVGSAATELAAKLFGPNAGIMKSHVLNRLTMEEKDGEFVVRVLKDGKPSALTMDELDKEFRANKDFASVLTGSGAGGGPRNPSKTVEEPGGFGMGKQQQDLRNQAMDIITNLDV